MSTSEEAFLSAAYYYSSLYNSLVLFAASPDYLDSLTGPSFDPVFELCAEYEYAFSYPAFNANFATGKVSETLKDELLIFKSRVNNLSSEH